MIGPLEAHGIVGGVGGLALALLIGMLFGFALERGGLGSATKLAGVFYGRDMTVVKVMFTAIVTAMVGLQYLGLFGRLDLAQVALLPTYVWPQIVGGVAFGVGFVMGGYCPGTALVAIGSGKKDALVFVAGIVFGTVLWGALFPWFAGFYGSGALGGVTLAGGLGLSPGVTALLVVLMALAVFRVATLVEQIADPSRPSADADAETSS